MSLEEEAKRRLKEQIDGKGIHVSKTWRFTSFSDLVSQIFGKKTKPEEQDNDRRKKDS